jgi:hypothetical protein
MTNSIIVVKGRQKTLLYASRHSRSDSSNRKKTGCTPCIFIQILYCIFYYTRRDEIIRSQEFEHCVADFNMKEFSCAEAQINGEGEE